MTPTTLAAGAAGALAAAGLLELVRVGARAARTRRGTRARTRRVRFWSLTLTLVRRTGRPLGRRAPDSLAVRVDAAGVSAALGDVMAGKAIAAAVGAVVALLWFPALPGRLGWLALLCAPPVGYFGPDLWLVRRKRRRAQQMSEEIGDVMDLLRVAVGAGLTLRRAVGEVGSRHPGALARELGRLRALLDLGVAFDDGIESLRRRCPVAGIDAFAAALLRAERHGTRLDESLAALADDARGRRTRASSETAARAAPKIQLVVALLLVPSALLLVAAALIPSLMR